jgi:hypothetical protein
MTDAMNWEDMSFMQKVVPAARIHAAEYVSATAQETRLLGHVFRQAGHLIPKIGPVLGKALATLCDESGNGLAWAAEKIRGGYKIEGLPKAMQYLPRMWRAIGAGSEKAMNFLTPEHIDGAVRTYGRVSDALKIVAPKLKLPVLGPAAA